MIRALVSAASVAALLAAVPAAAITYTVNVGNSTLGAVGFIKTDGTIGTIGTANIVDWNFALADNGVNFTLNGAANSQKLVQGSTLTATASGLFFDFSGTGLALFQNPNIGSGQNFICFVGNGVCGGAGNRISITTSSFGDGIAQRGLQQIGVAASGAVPEPSWAMLIAGFGLVGAVARRRKAVVAA
jgi:PEP-CTERM motif